MPPSLYSYTYIHTMPLLSLFQGKKFLAQAHLQQLQVGSVLPFTYIQAIVGFVLFCFVMLLSTSKKLPSPDHPIDEYKISATYHMSKSFVHYKASTNFLFWPVIISASSLTLFTLGILNDKLLISAWLDH